MRHELLPTTEMSAELWNCAVQVLETNSRRPHPQQWSGDTAFVAVGLAYVNPSRAWRDLRSLFEAQSPDGRVPHNRADRGGTGIMQPPLHAVAAWEVYRHAAAHGAVCAQEARTELRWLYPRLVAQQGYLSGPRDLGGGGLASIVHPWESGLDDSPAWDAMLAAVPAGFVVECPTFNAIQGAAELALAQIAGVLGRAAESVAHRERAQRITAAIGDRLWNPQTRTFHARDLRTGTLGGKHCVSGLLPLMLPDLTAEQVDGIMMQARSARFGLPVPSYDRTAADFDATRSWRGPIWINVNWLLRRGLLVHGFRDDAEELRTAMIRLVHAGGPFEYFHPDTGAGLGAPTFSGTAALALDLLADRSIPAYAR
jgi:hypothetical protein